MLIKHTDLSHSQPLTKLLTQPQLFEQFVLFIVCGEVSLQWDETINLLQKSLNIPTERLELESDADWHALTHRLNSYHLFSEKILINASWNKKSLEKNKPILNQYLDQKKHPNYLLLQTPEIPAKQWQWLANHKKVLIIQFTENTPQQLLTWIHQQFKKYNLTYDPDIPTHLLNYTYGNSAALAQAINRLSHSHTQKKITIYDLEQQLIDECVYNPFELSDACLTGDLGKAIHLLKQAQKQGTELPMLLGIYCRFLRQCIECTFLNKKNAPPSEYQTHGIWLKHINLYKKIARGVNIDQLYQLIFKAHQIDILLKTQSLKNSFCAFEDLLKHTLMLLQEN